MVDTIHLTVPIQELGGYDDWMEHSSSIAENLTRSRKPNGFRFASGNLGNLRLLVDERNLRIQGSIAKFLYGNNFEILQWGDLVEFIDCMSDTLNFDLGQCKITRLDFGYNIFCEYPPLTYIKLFTESSFFERHSHPSSVHYINGNRQFIAYDKIAQAKKHKEAIPDQFLNKHIIRLEARLMNTEQIKKYLEIDGSLDSLKSESAWESMPLIWENMYFLFNKEKEVYFDPAKIKRLKNVDDYYKAVGFNMDGGFVALQQRIEIMKSANTFKHAAYYSNLKRNYKSLINKLSKGNENQFILELDSKVKAAS